LFDAGLPRFGPFFSAFPSTLPTGLRATFCFDFFAHLVFNLPVSTPGSMAPFFPSHLMWRSHGRVIQRLDPPPWYALSLFVAPYFSDSVPFDEMPIFFPPPFLIPPPIVEGTIFRRPVRTLDQRPAIFDVFVANAFLQGRLGESRLLLCRRIDVIAKTGNPLPSVRCTNRITFLSFLLRLIVLLSCVSMI